MLNLSKLYPQIAKLGAYRSERRHELAGKLKEARTLLEDGSAAVLREKAVKARTSWLVALPLDEEPAAAFPEPEPIEEYSVVATDGSQIAPTRDGVGSLHLVNVGTVVMTYGRDSSARLTSEPFLAFEDSDHFVRFGGEEREVSGQVLNAKRDLAEYATLRKEVGELPPGPALALVDGTLILWHVELRADKVRSIGTADLKKEVFLEMFALFADGRRRGIPIAGYISAPAATDAVNLLKIAACGRDEIDCDKVCAGVPRTERSCSKLDGLTDALLFRSLLKKGERSAIFESYSSNESYILEAYPEEDRTCFFYLNAGTETARVEIPRWVADDPALKNRVHALVYDQAVKGRGYPISLAEAHEQAVVKGPDRINFERLVETALVKQGVRFEDSRKSLLKRGGFV